MSVSMVAVSVRLPFAVLPRWSLSVMGPFLFARFSLLLSLSVASILQSPTGYRGREGETERAAKK